VSYYRKSTALNSVGIYKMVNAKITLAQAMKAHISFCKKKKKKQQRISDKVTIVYVSLV